jgi:hypothetical protein
MKITTRKQKMTKYQTKKLKRLVAIMFKPRKIYSDLREEDISLRNSCKTYRQLRGLIQPLAAGKESCDDLADNLADYLYLASYGLEPINGKPSISRGEFQFPPRGVSYRKDLPMLMQNLGLLGGMISERNKFWHGYESYSLTTRGEDLMKKLFAEGYYEKTREK